jgi:hypothetical protein
MYRMKEKNNEKGSIVYRVSDKVISLLRKLINGEKMLGT